MNREIKFKGWNKQTSTMVDLHAITPLALDPSFMQDGVFLPFHDDIVLLQYTGLKDKNGVEIYEGDILSIEIDFGYGPCEVMAKVIWKDAGWQFDSESGCSYGANNIGSIIGNIHESPELLEAAQ